MPVSALKSVMNSMPAKQQAKMAQVIAMKDAAATGTPFCEECAKAKLKS
jgi:hypothetical protein